MNERLERYKAAAYERAFAQHESPKTENWAQAFFETHADLPFPETAIRRFIQVAVNFRLLPPEQALALPPSHHGVLYQVADPEERRRIGVRAAEQGVSVRKLREMVKGKGRRRPGGGRKPDPEFLKSWKQLKNVLASLDSASENREFAIATMTEELKGESREVRDLLTKILDRVADVPTEDSEDD